MNVGNLIATIAAIGSLGCAVPAAADAGPVSISDNWAGYEAIAGAAGFSAASAGWTQPAASCVRGASGAYSAFWVGLGGGSNGARALEQVGTQADCAANGSAYYYSWYELVPSPPVRLGLRISPGDQVYARIAISGNRVRIYLIDHTTGRSVRRTRSMRGAGPDTSTADWIAEAPSACSGSELARCTPLALADFGAVEFHNAYATAAGHTGSIANASWVPVPIVLDPSGGGGLSTAGGFSGVGGPSGAGAVEAMIRPSGSGASPSPLSSQGTAFTVTYRAGVLP